MNRLLSITHFLFVFSCILPVISTAKSLQVVTTTSDLKVITEAVGGEYVKVTSISTGKQDPHFIEAKPSYMIKLRKADLFIRIGLQLEIGWESLVLQGSRNSRIQMGTPGFLDASAGIIRLEVPAGPVDRSLGDVHTEGNPHYWLDPYNGRIIAHSIAERLSQLDPKHKEDYYKRKEDFITALDKAMFGEELLKKLPANTLWDYHTHSVLSEEIQKRFGIDLPSGSWATRMAPMRGIKIITYHKSWTYFLNRFGLTAVAQMEPKPGISPSPRHILNLINLVRNQNIQLIIMEPFYSEKAPKLVAQKTGINILKLAYSSGGDDNTNDYIALMDYIVSKISSHLNQQSRKEIP